MFHIIPATKIYFKLNVSFNCFLQVQYQSEERLRDIHEILESCQTKVQFIY